MKTTSTALRSILAFLVLTGMGPSGRGSDLSVLIIGNDEEIATLSNGLSSFGDFRSIDTIAWSVTPDPAFLSGYDAVVVTERYKPVPNSSAWGDIIADYAHNGGGVTIGFAFYSMDGPAVDYGRLQLAAYNPFTRGSLVPQDGSLGTILIPGDPIMAGVDELTTGYRYNIAANPNSVVVALFNDGVPLAGYLDVGSGRVVGIQAHFKLDPFFSNSGDYMQLYRNAIIASVPEPSSLVLMAVSIFATPIRRRIRSHRSNSVSTRRPNGKRNVEKAGGEGR